jgi:hypothetical protein
MDTATIHDDGPCTITHEGRGFTADGAHVGEDGGVAYFKGKDGVAHLGTRGALTDWHGNPLGWYTVTGYWRQYPPRGGYPVLMASVRAYVAGREYTGRALAENGRAVVLHRAKRNRYPVAPVACARCERPAVWLVEDTAAVYCAEHRPSWTPLVPFGPPAA